MKENLKLAISGQWSVVSGQRSAIRVQSSEFKVQRVNKPLEYN